MRTIHFLKAHNFRDSAFHKDPNTRGPQLHQEVVEEGTSFQYLGKETASDEDLYEKYVYYHSMLAWVHNNKHPYMVSFIEFKKAISTDLDALLFDVVDVMGGTEVHTGLFNFAQMSKGAAWSTDAERSNLKH